MAQVASKICEICVATHGEFFCQQCDQLFCKLCRTSHLRSKISKNHVFLHGPKHDSEVKFHCQQHKELFIYQCLECKEAVCRLCAVKSHKGHNMSDLSEYTIELKTKMKENIETNLKSLELNVSKLGKSTSKYRQEVQIAIRSITDEGTRLKKLIDAKVGDLIQSLQEEESKQMTTLTQMEMGFRSSIAKVNDYNQRFDSLQKCEGALDQKLNQLMSEMESTKIPILPTMPTASYEQNRGTNADINQLFGSLTTLDIKYSIVTERPFMTYSPPIPIAPELRLPLKKNLPEVPVGPIFVQDSTGRLPSSLQYNRLRVQTEHSRLYRFSCNSCRTEQLLSESHLCTPGTRTLACRKCGRYTYHTFINN